jgi:hypothetical protein
MNIADLTAILSALQNSHSGELHVEIEVSKTENNGEVWALNGPLFSISFAEGSSSIILSARATR